jgi:DNA-binding XRE family transcriptional regulator
MAARHSFARFLTGLPSEQKLIVVAQSGKRTRGRPRAAETKLSRWIDASGMTRDTVAVELGVDRTYVDKLCRGQHRPGLEVALRLEKLTEGEIPASYWVGTGVHRR